MDGFFDVSCNKKATEWIGIQSHSLSDDKMTSQDQNLSTELQSFERIFLLLRGICKIHGHN